MRITVAKAVADLRSYPLKVTLLWLSIATGSLAVMAAFGARLVLEREIERSFARSRPAAVVLWTDDVDAVLLRKVSNVEGVAGVDARRLVRARVAVPGGEWRSLLVYGVRDFSDIVVARVYPVEGGWPPPLGSVVLEQSGLSVIHGRLGTPIRVRVPGPKGNQSLHVSGISHDPARAPGWQDNLGYAYATPATLGLLGLGTELNELHVDVPGSRQRAEEVAARVRGVVTAMGLPVHRVEVPPRRHPHADHMHAMLLLLQVLALLSLLLSALLAANLFAAMLAQQVRQVGVMKTLGATKWTVARIYLSQASLVAMPASIVGSLGGIVAAKQFSRFAADQLNLHNPSVDISFGAITAVIAIGTLVPLIAAWVPIRRAAAMRVREAIQDTGIRWDGPRTPFSFGPALPVSLRLALRNSLRRPGRFGLTVVALAVGGAMFMTAANVHRALIAAVDSSLSSRTDDLEVRFLEPVPSSGLVASLSAVEGVKEVVPWGAVMAGFAHPAQDPMHRAAVIGRYSLLAPPKGIQPRSARVVQGRWLAAENEGVEIVVNRQLLAVAPHLAPGVETTALVGAKSTPVRIVGVVEEIAAAAAYVTPPGMERVLGAAGSSGAVRVDIRDDVDPSSVAREIEVAQASKGWFPVYQMTREQLRRAMVDHFMILLVVLLALAGAAIFVGVLGLSTTMSINVLERQKEIGVAKATGASRWAIRKLVLVEGAATSSASVVLALVLSMPLSVAVGFVVGSHGLHVSLPYRTSIEGILLWVSLAAIATVVACLGPAERSLRLPVRQLIAYE
ncbi:MAG: ABC transporter permease [Myxococcota bacterium]